MAPQLSELLSTSGWVPRALVVKSLLLGVMDCKWPSPLGCYLHFSHTTAVSIGRREVISPSMVAPPFDVQGF
eukprot:1269631-Amphidinium_carterae.1